MLMVLLMPGGVYAQQPPAYQSKYIGQEQRVIKSLSADDIEQLESGKGWGLAKAAELNGMPGPVHVLQMKDRIALTREQEQKITALYNDMKSQAVPLGRQLVELERDLNQSFKTQAIDAPSLRAKLEKIAAITAELRYVHLWAHLATPALLTAEQITLYNNLRGYSDSDPCANIPAGHDAEMWRKHNGCQ
jgi:Spy/CpxP family protein refolding chaperone